MTGIEAAAWAQAVAGFLTLGTAGLAVWAAFRAPRLAADFAEQLRKQTQAEERERQLKTQIFATLLQHRATIAYEQSVNALNMIPVAFKKSPQVRDAFDHFLTATEAKPADNSVIVERYLIVIEKIAHDVGLSEEISYKDIRRYYSPEILSKVRAIQQKQVFDQFDQAFPSELANTAPVPVTDSPAKR